MTTTQARTALAEHFGADTIEALMDTAQELGEVTIGSTSGHNVTLIADDNAQCWYVRIAVKP